MLAAQEGNNRYFNQLSRKATGENRHIPVLHFLTNEFPWLFQELSIYNYWTGTVDSNSDWLTYESCRQSCELVQLIHWINCWENIQILTDSLTNESFRTNSKLVQLTHWMNSDLVSLQLLYTKKCGLLKTIQIQTNSLLYHLDQIMKGFNWFKIMLVCDYYTSIVNC